MAWEAPSCSSRPAAPPYVPFVYDVPILAGWSTCYRIDRTSTAGSPCCHRSRRPENVYFCFKACLSSYAYHCRAYRRCGCTYLPFLSPIFGHVSVCEFYMSHPIRRPVKRLTAHVARQWCIFFLLQFSIFVCTMYDFLRQK